MIHNHLFSEKYKDIDFYQDFTKVNNCSKSIDLVLNQCDDCGSNDILQDIHNGIIVCKQCGQVLNLIIDYTHEWNNFAEGIDESRCGGAVDPLFPISSIGTYISGANSQLKRTHNWSIVDPKERSLLIEFKKISNICQKYNILKCIEDDSKIIYKNASQYKHTDGKYAGKIKISRGNKRIAIIGACIHFACIKNGIAYTTKEIAEMCSITAIEINCGIKMLKMFIGDFLPLKTFTYLPCHFIKRYCNNLNILQKHTNDAYNISLNITKLNIFRNLNITALAAISIYLVVINNKKDYPLLTIKKIIKVFMITEITFNNTYKKIEKYVDVLLSQEKTNEIQKKLQEKATNESDDDIPPEILEKMKEFNITLNK